MEHQKTFCNTFATDVHTKKFQVLHPKIKNKKFLLDGASENVLQYFCDGRTHKKIPGFASKKTKQKVFD